MGIYIVYWLIFSLFSIIETGISGLCQFVNLHRKLIYIVFGMLVFLIGFRWETGSDWQPYLDFYKDSVYRNFFEPDSYMDYGYVVFNNLCYFINKDYSTLLIIHSVFFFFFLKKSFEFFTPYVVLCLFIYMATNYGMTGSNRQLMAIAFGLFALVKYLQKEYYYSLFFLVIAMLFHNTAILIVLYIFFNRRIQIRYLLIILSLSIIIGFSDIVQNLFISLGALSELTQGKVAGYANSENYGVTSLSGIIRRGTLILICFLFADKLRSKNKYYDLWMNSYLYTVFGLFLFQKAPVLSGRAMLYFNMSEAIIFTYLVSILPSKIRFFGVFAICCLMIVYFFQSFQMYPSLFIPYKGIFINEFYNRLVE